MPTYLRRNKAAIADEQQQIETFMGVRDHTVRSLIKEHGALRLFLLPCKSHCSCVCSQCHACMSVHSVMHAYRTANFEG